MKKLMVVVGLATAFVSGIALAKKSSLIIKSVDAAKWAEMPSSSGAMISPLWGDPMKGAYGAIVRLPSGSANPLHTHTGDMKVVVISGTWIYAPEGEPVHRLDAGSYTMIPGNSKHTSACDVTAPCMVFQEMSRKFDMNIPKSGR